MPEIAKKYDARISGSGQFMNSLKNLQARLQPIRIDMKIREDYVARADKFRTTSRQHW